VIDNLEQTLQADLAGLGIDVGAEASAMAAMTISRSMDFSRATASAI
jgi:hypothetical protein